MPKVEIYTKMLCPFCTEAKALLNELKTDFVEHKIFWSPSKFSAVSYTHLTLPTILLV